MGRNADDPRRLQARELRGEALAPLGADARNGASRRFARPAALLSGGTKLDSFETNVPNAGGVQLTDLFTSRGITSSQPKPVIIRVSPAAGLFGAFATMIDNRTNDPMYLGAGLTSQ